MLSPAVLLVAFLASSIGAICGIGGGVIIKPVLDAVTDLDTVTIGFLSSCTVLAMAVTTFITRKIRKEVIKFDLFVSSSSLLGGMIGNYLFGLLKEASHRFNLITLVQSSVLFVLLLIVLLYSLIKTKIQPLLIDKAASKLILGFSLGCISSFLGIGGGPINVAAFMFFLSKKSKEAANFSLLIIMFAQSSNLLTSLVTKKIPNVEASNLFTMVIVGVLGGIIGRMISHKIKEQEVDKLFNVAIIVILLLCATNIMKNI